MDSDKETELALQKQRDELDRQLRMRQRANAKARKEEEDRQLIAAGTGPRRAKVQALKDATWFEAQGKKRPHSPEKDLVEEGNAMTTAKKQQSANTGTAKRQKGQAVGEQSDDGAGHGGERMKSTARRVAAKRQAPKGRGSEELEERNGGGERTRSTTVKPHSHNVRSGPKTAQRTKASKPPKAIVQIPEPEDDSESPRPSSPESEGPLKDNSTDSEDNNEDFSGEEDDRDIRGLTDKDLERVFYDEAPRDACNLFDDDMEVDTASVKSHRTYRSASSVTRPPTSESEGFLDDDNDDDNELSQEDEEPLDELPLKKSKGTRSSKQLSKRDTAFKAEASRPATLPSRRGSSRQIAASTVHIDSDVEVPIKTKESDWPEVTRLNHGGLLQQNDFIRATCRDAIKIVERTLVAEHAWPELHRAAAYKRHVLGAAVKGLVAKNKQYRHISERVTRDDKFVKATGRWVIDRLSHHRGTIRGLASEFIALYQLGIGEGCAQRVKALLDNDIYVYPGEWGTDSKGKPVWVTKGSMTDVQIYLNPGLIELMRAAFFTTTTSLGNKPEFKELYISSHPMDPKPELTIPLVALGATALFAALWEWRSGQKVKTDGKKNKSERFEGDIFKTVYQRHIDTLTAFKAKANTYHRVMSTIYAKVTEQNNLAGGGNNMGNALAVLDLDGLD